MIHIGEGMPHTCLLLLSLLELVDRNTDKAFPGRQVRYIGVSLRNSSFRTCSYTRSRCHYREIASSETRTDTRPTREHKKSNIRNRFRIRNICGHCASTSPSTAIGAGLVPQSTPNRQQRYRGRIGEGCAPAPASAIASQSSPRPSSR